MSDGKVLTTRLGREDAMLLLRGWAQDRTLLRCDVRFIRCACMFRGRIRALGPERVELLDDDILAEAVIPLGSDVEFGTADFRRSSGDEAERYDIFLTIFIPVADAPEHPESITLTKFKDSQLTC